MGDGALKNLLAEANWFRPARRHLAGGAMARMTPLLFLVVTGCLGVFVSDAQGQRRMVSLAARRRDGGRRCR